MDSEKKTALILGQRVEGVYLRSCNNNEIAKLVRWICLSPVKLGIILDGRSLVLGRNVTAVITNYAITSYVYVSKLSAGDVHNTWKVFDDELRRPERPAGRGRGSAVIGNLAPPRIWHPHAKFPRDIGTPSGILAPPCNREYGTLTHYSLGNMVPHASKFS